MALMIPSFRAVRAVLPTLLIVTAFISCLACALYGWNRTLLDFHAFRQTQTALSTYYFVKEGWRLDYQTPVLGKPWSIPLEFPIFQSLVALAVKVIGSPLDQTGRAVSLAFWMACLCPLYGLLRLWGVEKVSRWEALLLICSTPTYIYWSRCFLIESTALFFSLTYFYSAMRVLRGDSLVWGVAAIFLGSAAALQKPTTFLILLVPLLLSIALELWERKGSSPSLTLLMPLAAILIIPFLVLSVWTVHAGYVRSLNAFATIMLNPTTQFTWNFGTLQQRLTPRTWPWALVPGFRYISRGETLVEMVVIAVALARGRRFRREIVILLGGYLAGPAIFYNLFFVHNYYAFENQVYLVLAFGLALFSLVEMFLPELKRPYFRHLAVGIFVFIGLATYAAEAFPVIRTAPYLDEVHRELAPLRNPDAPAGTLLIYGYFSWEPMLPYYSERKSLMDSENRPLDNPEFRDEQKLLSPDEQITAMMIKGPLARDASFVKARVDFFGLQATCIPTAWGDLYLKKKSP
jgi:hypothetical protein